MKKQLLLLMMTLLPMAAMADAVEIDGIYYNLFTKNGASDAEVTSNPNKYTGVINIPEYVAYEGLSYTVIRIGAYAFGGCEGLVSIKLPNSLKEIGNYAFRGCTGLTTIAIPNSVTSFGNSIFLNCKGLTSVFLPNNISYIQNNMFSGCTGLTNFDIPNTVTDIYNGAFSGCEGLQSITIPNSVTLICSGTFENCSGLTTITVPNSVTKLDGGAFKNCTGLTSVTLSNNITTIENNLFEGCTGLTSFVVPNNVNKIGDLSFAGCNNLTTVTLPQIYSIGRYAFAWCPNLSDVYCYAINAPKTEPFVFEESYIEYATLYVLDSSINSYKNTYPWNNFKEILAVEGTTPETPKCEKPTISYKKGQLKFSSATEGAEFISEITNADAKKNYDATVTLTATYNISVYATKSGYDNSDAATATLCWIESDPKTEGITDGVAQIPAKAVLIQSEGGILKVEGIDDGTPVSVFTPDGKNAGSAVCRNGAALVDTNIQPGTVAIVKIDNQAVKVVIK